MCIISDFISKVQSTHKTGAATEHSYRSALETLFSSLEDGVTALNEPKRVACGAPDFIIQRGEITVGHVEAKDLGIGLRGMKDANKGQQERYRKALPNLIYTNCLDWDFYRNGDLVSSITIADYIMGIQPKPNQYEPLENLLRDFIAQRPQTITSPRVLAEMMAGKAVLIKDILANALRADKDLQTDLIGQFKAFQEHLIHDITPEDFADIYAETIAYGMFAARLHDTTLDTFTRQEALELLPKSNPFLRSLFGYIAGPNLDDRIAWVIDDLAKVFQAANVAKLMEGFGKLTGQNDPFLHFYETFLAAYNPAKRKARGVWYTPEPVVNFIVRAVDEVLQTEFGLPDGLADTSKITVDWDTGQTNNKGKAVTIKKEVHRVQILDPATGTGTFLAEVIKQIAPKVKDVAEGMWSPYIEKDLIPRLHGFELLMASYAMCHMKLDMILTEMGYKPTAAPPRLGVYLTNSLEEGDRDVRDLFMAQWLTREAQEASTIKRQTPIMCVIGNPPYSGESSNKGDWIMGLMEAYKKEPGGKEKLKERNPKWINDDYVKFIRFGEHLIEKTGEGVLGFITNHGYLDNPTFRGMRWKLLDTFDKIYVLDLHGSTKKKEVSPDGGADTNVFDIMPGVSIVIAVKKKTPAKSCTVFRADMWGSRQKKYDLLAEGKLNSGQFEVINPQKPRFEFTQNDAKLQSVYFSYTSLKDLFLLDVLGFQTHRDNFAIAWSKNEAISTIREMVSGALDDAQFATKYGVKDNRDWKLSEQRTRARADVHLDDSFTQCLYRPFDQRWCHFSNYSMDYPRRELLVNVLHKENFCILASRQQGVPGFMHTFVSSLPANDCAVSNKSREANQVFPLYLYPSEQDLDQKRRINFDLKHWKNLQKKAKHPAHGTPDEVQTFDYIYGVLHCPTYRETYAEFLKVDFPRIPWPTTPDEFWDISAKGAQLRKLHLMDPAAIGPAPYTFKGQGDGTVEQPRFEDGKVWINETQYFDAAPEVSWTFYIGGYQPAQKWLKDRKGRELSFVDVKHYQRILKILSETDRIMKTITMTLAVAK
jgi:hypothetical protein